VEEIFVTVSSLIPIIFFSENSQLDPSLRNMLHGGVELALRLCTSSAVAMRGAIVLQLIEPV
jgi:hypothetical protein